MSRSLVLALIVVFLIGTRFVALAAESESVTITCYGNSLFKVEFEGSPRVLTDLVGPGDALEFDPGRCSLISGAR